MSFLTVDHNKKENYLARNRTNQNRNSSKGKYSFEETNEIAKIASRDIEKYLSSLPYTESVINVELDKTYQGKDVDLIWEYHSKKKGLVPSLLEIKGDRYYSRSNNYFLETYSNKGKGTKGCFMYTESDFFLYYFVPERILHILPTEIARKWFKKHMHKFKEVTTSTPYRNGQGYYVTVGRLVDRDILKKGLIEEYGHEIQIKDLNLYLK